MQGSLPINLAAPKPSTKGGDGGVDVVDGAEGVVELLDRGEGAVANDVGELGDEDVLTHFPGEGVEGLRPGVGRRIVLAR